MALINLPNKPKQFHYQPRYYDERKERLEQMKARAQAELAEGKREIGSIGTLHKGFLSERRANSKHRYSLERKSALRFFIILLAILGITYFIAPDLFMAFWKIK